MDDLQTVEDELRSALRHVPAPEGFTGRVLQQVAQREAGRKGVAEVRKGGLAAGTLRHAGWWAAAAAALAITVGGGDALHLRHQRQAAESRAAQAQVDLAMQLTGHALNEVEIGLDRSPAGRYTQLFHDSQ